MHRVILLLVLVPFTVFSQESRHWTSDLNIKVGYGTNFGFRSDLNVTGFDRYTPDHGTFRLGLGKDFRLASKWQLLSTLELDWVQEVTEFRAAPSATGFDSTIGTGVRSSSGGDLQFSLSLPINYNIINKDHHQLGIALGPEFNFNFVEVFGGGGLGIGENNSILSYEEIAYENTVFRPSALIALNYKTRFGNLPVRAQAFFSYSLSNQYSGTFEYQNNFNGETQIGDFEMIGHKAGVSLAFFPFNNGDPNKKKQRDKKEKEKKERSNQIGTTRFGFKAGVNFSDITGDGTGAFVGETSGYAGTELYGGLFSDTKISRNWNLQTEGIFSYTDDLLFLEVPVLFKRKVVKNVWAFAGPKVQMIINETPDVTNSVGLGFDIGGQYDLPKNFFIEARYGFGLTNQINSEFFDVVNANRNVLRLGIGYKF